VSYGKQKEFLVATVMPGFGFPDFQDALAQTCRKISSIGYGLRNLNPVAGGA
jgi:hypothetical protein